MIAKEKQKITFRMEICVENDGTEFHAFCPALEGVHIDGKTQEEALENAKIAVSLYIQSLIKHGDPIPLRVIVSAEPQATCQNSNFICPPQQRHMEDVFVTL